MEVIFLEDVANVAHAGDVRRVADGFARNYLLPKRLATLATPEGLKQVERLKEAGRQRRIKETEHLEALAQELEGTTVTVAGKVAPTGRYYGAITPTQIAQALSQLTGREIDRKLLEVIESLREPGSYQVSLHLAPSISATINILAEAQE